jgi:hypothetical protein
MTKANETVAQKDDRQRMATLEVEVGRFKNIIREKEEAIHALTMRLNAMAVIVKELRDGPTDAVYERARKAEDQVERLLAVTEAQDILLKHRSERIEELMERLRKAAP